MEECPGLNSSKGIWYVPQGKTISDLTVCNQCRKKYSEYEVFVQVSDKQVECNCDGFLYGNKLDNGLFNISFWEDKSTYLDTSVNGEVYLNEGTKFNIFISGKLADNQYFKYEILCNNDVIVPLTKVAFKRDVSDGYTFNYIGQIEQTAAQAVSRLSNTGILLDTDTLTVRLYLFKLVTTPNITEYTNTFMGDFAMINSNSITIKSTQEKDSDYILKTKQGYVSPVILSTGKWVQCNIKPLDIKVKFVTLEKYQGLHPYVKTLIDRSKKLLEDANLKNSFELKRFKSMKREIESQINTLIQKTKDNIQLLDEIEQDGDI